MFNAECCPSSQTQRVFQATPLAGDPPHPGPGTPPPWPHSPSAWLAAWADSPPWWGEATPDIGESAADKRPANSLVWTGCHERWSAVPSSYQGCSGLSAPVLSSGWFSAAWAHGRGWWGSTGEGCAWGQSCDESWPGRGVQGPGVGVGLRSGCSTSAAWWFWRGHQGHSPAAAVVVLQRSCLLWQQPGVPSVLQCSTGTHACSSVHIHTTMYICTHVQTHLHEYTHTYKHTQTHTNTHKHTHIHTHTHTHTHTNI